MIEKHVKIYRSIFLGTVGTVVQLLKLRGFEGRKVAQCELETISFFGTVRYSWYRVILGPSVSNHCDRRKFLYARSGCKGQFKTDKCSTQGGNSFLCQSTWTSPVSHVYTSTTLTTTSVYVIFLWSNLY